ncbi:MAG: 16S rRNA (cytidine(1402)-2'-O)-methyltransferase [Acidiferrobacterales bacterium]|nr:16S rRNA (cytidine(1402)-2'-O)-methyltransferase [Acidiferrobacterales bacterium]
MSNGAGTIYLVATPIGNLEDMTPRATRILSEVDLIAAEDTRHSAPLLKHLGVRTPMVAYHEHNEDQKAPELIKEVLAGKSIALISDAGTPLLSDPGFRLVTAAHNADITVSPIPGPCAAIVALSASGLATNEFLFAGFPPPKQGARQHFFERYAAYAQTLIFYESAHRIVDSITDMAAVFGDDRMAVVARELTKKFETIRQGPLAELCHWVANDPNQQKGEFVVLVQGRTAPAGEEAISPETERLLSLLAAELPPKKAAAIVAEVSGLGKNRLYQWLIEQKSEKG